jgi:hypothetical protein
VDDVRVYELDVDSLVAQLRDVLAERGVEVTEQVPAGLWWLRGPSAPNAARQTLETAFSELLSQCLRPVED